MSAPKHRASTAEIEKMQHDLHMLKNAHKDPIYKEGMQRFAHALRALRQQKNITQQELADKLNVKRTSISNWESAHCMPYAGELLALCAELETTPDTLLGLNAHLIEELHTLRIRIAELESQNRTGINTPADRVANALSDKVDALTKDLENALLELNAYREQNDQLRTDLRQCEYERTQAEDASGALPFARMGEFRDALKERDGLRAHCRDLQHRINVATLALKGA